MQGEGHIHRVPEANNEFGFGNVFQNIGNCILRIQVPHRPFPNSHMFPSNTVKQFEILLIVFYTVVIEIAIIEMRLFFGAHVNVGICTQPLRERGRPAFGRTKDKKLGLLIRVAPS